MNTCRSEANQLQLFVFLTICGSKSNNYSTLMHKTRIRRIKIHLTTQKWLNIVQYLPECYSIFDIRNDIHFEVEYIEVKYFNREPSHIR